MADCAAKLYNEGKASPRTCQLCGLGPCRYGVTREKVGPAVAENFKDHPPTIGEIRSQKNERAEQWSPRDALINILRLIDSGELQSRCVDHNLPSSRRGS